MGCCGETIQTAKNIAVGFTNYARGKKYVFTNDRIRKCWTCDEQTWMSKREYAVWLQRNGIKVLRNFAQLEKLPKLPKYEQSPTQGRTNLYCRICKCFIPAKARVEDEKCPIGKWPRTTLGTGQGPVSDGMGQGPVSDGTGEGI